MNSNPASMLEDYASGKMTVKDIAKKYGLSTGKAYYVLRDGGCEFTRRNRHPMSAEARARIGAAQKGKRLSDAQREAISKRNSCDYNGLNGYGHTKQHSRGYVLAYAPKHPHAHKDGYVMLHTIVVERMLGRYLAPDEVVHHINHNRQDNRPENLRLMKKHEHMTMHMTERHAMKRSGSPSIA